MTNLILIRGLPGSAKSTLAKSLIRDNDNGVHFEADMYFQNTEGEYIFDQTKLHQAHMWCQEQTMKYLRFEYDVVVSNTFTTIKELKPYFDIADEFGIVPQVILCQNQFNNVHDVPQEALDRMKNRFCYDISPLFNRVKEVA